MTLTEWMKLEGYRDADVAALTGVDRATICRVRNGVYKPSEPLLLAIFEASKMRVTANDFYHTTLC